MAVYPIIFHWAGLDNSKLGLFSLLLAVLQSATFFPLGSATHMHVTWIHTHHVIYILPHQQVTLESTAVYGEEEDLDFGDHMNSVSRVHSYSLLCPIISETFQNNLFLASKSRLWNRTSGKNLDSKMDKCWNM